MAAAGLIHRCFWQETTEKIDGLDGGHPGRLCAPERNLCKRRDGSGMGPDETCARVGVDSADFAVASPLMLGFASWAVSGFARSGGCHDDRPGSLEIACNGGEVDLDGGFGEAPPSHSSQTVAAFPGPEDLLDPGANAMDRLVPGIETSVRFGFVAALHAGGNDTGGFHPWLAPRRRNAGRDKHCRRTPLRGRLVGYLDRHAHH